VQPQQPAVHTLPLLTEFHPFDRGWLLLLEKVMVKQGGYNQAVPAAFLHL